MSCRKGWNINPSRDRLPKISDVVVHDDAPAVPNLLPVGPLNSRVQSVSPLSPSFF